MDPHSIFKLRLARRLRSTHSRSPPPGPFNTSGENVRAHHTYVPRVRSRLSREYDPSSSSSSTASPPSTPTLSPLSLVDTFIPEGNDTSPSTTASRSSRVFDWSEVIGPNMALPGLGLDDVEDTLSQNLTSFSGTASTNAPSQTQVYDLQPQTEWRFETALNRSITIKTLSGQSLIFGTELAVGHSYTFTTTKAAIFTLHGSRFEVVSDYGPLSSALTSEYVAEETPFIELGNIHFALEKMRQQATIDGIEGPRILILGPDSSGKTSLAKTITAFGVRSGHSPVVVNLDPSEGVLSLPATMTGTVFKSMLEVEEGWGNAPMSGPNGEIPVKVPLVYYYGSMVPEEKSGVVFKSQVRQLALAVAGKAADDQVTKFSGTIVDTPGSIVNARAAGAGYDIVSYIVSEFGINGILCLGSERLYSDMVRKFDKTNSSRSNTTAIAGQEPEKISVVKVTKSGGVAERDSVYMRTVRDAQVKKYFYGSPRVGAGISLQPRQQQVEFDSLTVWRRISANGPATSLVNTFTNNNNHHHHNNSMDDEDSFLPGGADDSELSSSSAAAATTGVPLPASQIFERLTSPVPALRNCVLAVMNCEPEPEAGTEQEVLRDSSVMGFLYVTDVDEVRGRISLLSPVAGRVPNRALVWGEGVDGVLGLV